MLEHRVYAHLSSWRGRLSGNCSNINRFMYCGRGVCSNIVPSSGRSRAPRRARLRAGASVMATKGWWMAADRWRRFAFCPHPYTLGQASHGLLGLLWYHRVTGRYARDPGSTPIRSDDQPILRPALPPETWAGTDFLRNDNPLGSISARRGSGVSLGSRNASGAADPGWRCSSGGLSARPCGRSPA
jgi:hypothetical protein